jgi:hypothetical protein
MDVRNAKQNRDVRSSAVLFSFDVLSVNTFKSLQLPVMFTFLIQWSTETNGRSFILTDFSFIRSLRSTGHIVDPVCLQGATVAISTPHELGLSVP